MFVSKHETTKGGAAYNPLTLSARSSCIIVNQGRTTKMQKNYCIAIKQSEDNLLAVQKAMPQSDSRQYTCPLLTDSFAYAVTSFARNGDHCCYIALLQFVAAHCILLCVLSCCTVSQAMVGRCIDHCVCCLCQHAMFARNVLEQNIYIAATVIFLPMHHS